MYDPTAKGYDRWAHGDKTAPPSPPSVVGTRRRPRAREAQRQRLFHLCTPKMILAPANVVAVHLADAPMWDSWDWPATAEANAKMLPFVQQLDPGDPLPNDPRLALPMTVAGFWLYRALLVDPAGAPRNSVGVVMDVYDEIKQAIVVLSRRWADAVERKSNGEVSAGFLSNFYQAVNTAEILLFHAVRLGPEMWDLILRCRLGNGCKYGEPYYVSLPNPENPKDKRAWHPNCRVGKSRAKGAQERVTLKPVPKKK